MKSTEIVLEANNYPPTTNIKLVYDRSQKMPGTKVVQLGSHRGFIIVKDSDPRPEVIPNFELLKYQHDINSRYRNLEARSKELSRPIGDPDNRKNINDIYATSNKVHSNQEFKKIRAEISKLIAELKRLQDIPKYIVKEASSPAQQAAIAINMKKRGKKPKHNESVMEADKTDTVSMDIPLLLRMMEYAREDAKTDLDLHDVAEKMIALSKNHDYLCMDNYNEIVGSAAHDHVEESCPHCGGRMLPESRVDEKKDACYYKVKSRYKVWPSAYASGALVKCRKAGSKNWGNKSK